MDGFYKPDYNGENVNVFVVDSGIDTQHLEFESNTRTVRNVYDSYNYDDVLSPNNDGVGHGTHCAGTIGGNTVGVSPLTNIYGVRVLTAQGSGSDLGMYICKHVYIHLCMNKSLNVCIAIHKYIHAYMCIYILIYIFIYIDIINGLAFVYDWYLTNGKPPSVVSMSLGGECFSYEECAEDILVQAVEELSKVGIIVVTAAGNSDCDSCLQTPAYAPSAITVGASSAADQGAIFSDFGKCIDIYAPGVNITSACGSAMCPLPLNKLTARTYLLTVIY